MSRNLPCILKPGLTNVFPTSILVVIVAMATTNALAQPKPGSWSNPNLIEGSSFGHIFQGLYKTGKYETLLRLTASDSRRQYGDQVITKYYQQMQFAYPLKLISSSHEGASWILNYKTTISATVAIIKMKVVLESDTCRLVLPQGFNEQQYFLATWK